jgi:hypothetical protein
MQRRAVFSLVLALLLRAAAPAQERITSPREQLGFSFGDDYQLANYCLRRTRINPT